MYVSDFQPKSYMAMFREFAKITLWSVLTTLVVGVGYQHATTNRGYAGWDPIDIFMALLSLVGLGLLLGFLIWCAWRIVLFGMKQ